MQLEATGQPIRYRLKTGEEFTLRPGVPMELPDQAATNCCRRLRIKFGVWIRYQPCTLATGSPGI